MAEKETRRRKSLIRRKARQRRGRRRRRSLLTHFRNAFLTGLIVSAPLAITVFLIRWFVNFLDEWFKPLIPAQYQPDLYLPFTIPGVGVVLALIIFTLIGWLTTSLVGGWLVRRGEGVIRRIPAAGTIYATLKQLLTATLSQDSSTFKQVALIEYPRKGLYAIAFVTKDAEDKLNKAVGKDLVGVFVPTTPNPTSGFLLFVPRKDLVILDMSVEEGARLVISAGISDEESDGEATQPARK